MTKFSVPGMSCRRCTSTIERSIKAVDGSARVDCDVKARTVSVDSITPEPDLLSAIRGAGYHATVAPAA